MKTKVKIAKELKAENHFAVIVNSPADLKKIPVEAQQQEFIKAKIDKGESFISIPTYNYRAWVYIIVSDEKEVVNKRYETLRRAGNELAKVLLREKSTHIQLWSVSKSEKELLYLLEGLLLGSYKFDKYLSKAAGQSLEEVSIVSSQIEAEEMEEISILSKAVCWTRDLVNEPLSYLTAEKFSAEIEKAGEKAGFKTEILQKSKIQSLGMGGLLAVNAGSENPPTFNVLVYKPSNALNKKPLVLVGKGVVYDTGGLSLKSAEGMEQMKCDMAGGAAVAGAFCAVAQNKLPVYLVGLIPATENRPSGNAMAPGDVITMFDGTTVEVLNTDAEGRLILADALAYGKKFDPELVLDLATLTGSAARAIGKEGAVMLGNAGKEEKDTLVKSGYEVHERLVEFPLWEEYRTLLKSDIADLKNIGGAEAGAITAAKFLEHFTAYPWMHLDIAGIAFLNKEDSYRGKNASGFGVRLLYNFIKRRYKKI